MFNVLGHYQINQSHYYHLIEQYNLFSEVSIASANLKLCGGAISIN